MGRELKQENDLFFLCSLIEQIGRMTKNKRIDVVINIGKTELAKILELADIYHCEPIEYTAEDLIERFEIQSGKFDNITVCKYNIPTVFDIGKVYKRLIIYVSNSRKCPYTETLVDVYSSPVAAKIDDYNSSVYFENPEYIEKFFEFDVPPEMSEFYAEKFAKELYKAFTEMPEYIKRECNGNFTPFNVLKIMLRDNVRTLLNSPKLLVRVIDECRSALGVSDEKFAKNIDVDVKDITAFYEKCKAN